MSDLGSLISNLLTNDITEIECDGITLYADDDAFCLVNNSFDMLMHKVYLLVNDISWCLSYKNLFQIYLKLFDIF